MVDVTSQAAFNRRDRTLVGVDKAVLGMPAPRCEIGQRESDPSVDLLCGHAGRQRWIRKVHCRRIKTDQHYAFHRPSSEPANSAGARSATPYMMRDILERLPFAREILATLYFRSMETKLAVTWPHVGDSQPTRSDRVNNQRS